MTLDEAIIILKDCELNPCVSKDKEAAEMAIKALEQEPKWIPVSERLPEVTETFTDGDFDDWYTAYESSEVLVFGTCEGGREKHIYTADYNEWIHEDGRKECEWRDNLSGDIEINVIAWCPLPEPYKESEEE